MKFLFLLTLTSLFTLSSCTKHDELGSSGRPIVFTLVPGQDVRVLETEGKNLEEWFKQDLNLHFKVMVPMNFLAVVESIGSNRTDIALMNTFGYVLAHHKYKARVRLIGLYNNKDVYWGQIIARKDSGIKSVTDLNGKKFAYVDAASTSGYILPKRLLEKQNIKLKEFTFAGKHDSVVTKVYQGQVDAGATYHVLQRPGHEPEDARLLVKTQYPDILDKVVIIEKTGPIPNDPVVFRENFPKDLEEKIAISLKKFIKTEKGKQTMLALYHMDDLKDADDSHFLRARELYKDILEKNPK